MELAFQKELTAFAGRHRLRHGTGYALESVLEQRRLNKERKFNPHPFHEPMGKRAERIHAYAQKRLAPLVEPGTVDLLRYFPRIMYMVHSGRSDAERAAKFMIDMAAEVDVPKERLENLNAILGADWQDNPRYIAVKRRIMDEGVEGPRRRRGYTRRPADASRSPPSPPAPTSRSWTWTPRLRARSSSYTAPAGFRVRSGCASTGSRWT